MQDTISTNSSEFHLLATLFNVYATQEIMDDIVEGDGTTKEIVHRTTSLLQSLGYDVDWSENQ